MKKFFAVLLAVLMVLSLGVSAMAASEETGYQDSEEANAIRERNRATVEKYFEVEVNSAEQMALCADDFTMEQPFWGVEGAEEDQSAAMSFPEGFQMPEWTPEWHWNDDLVIWGTDDPTFFVAYNSGYGLQLNDKNELCEYHNIYFHTFKFNDEGLIEVYQEIGNPLNLMDAMGIEFTFPQPSDTLNALILLYLEENPDIAEEYWASQEASGEASGEASAEAADEVTWADYQAYLIDKAGANAPDLAEFTAQVEALTCWEDIDQTVSPWDQMFTTIGLSTWDDFVAAGGAGASSLVEGTMG